MSENEFNVTSWKCPACSSNNQNISNLYPEEAPPHRKEWCVECEGLDIDRPCGKSHRLPCEIDVDCPDHE